LRLPLVRALALHASPPPAASARADNDHVCGLLAGDPPDQRGRVADGDAAFSALVETMLAHQLGQLPRRGDTVRLHGHALVAVAERGNSVNNVREHEPQTQSFADCARLCDSRALLGAV